MGRGSRPGPGRRSNLVRVCLPYWRRCPGWYLQSSLLGSLGTRREVSVSLRFDWVDEPPCHRRTYVLPTQQRTLLPDLPVGGFRSEAQLAAVPGVRVIEAADIDPGPTPDIYTFSREIVQRNLYRVPLR
jgi:hypothetical protein